MEKSADIRAAINRACELNGVPELANKITFKFSEKMTSCGGKANGAKKKITLSSPYWRRAPKTGVDSRENTVYHEICHIIVYYKWEQSGGVKPKPHGDEWKRAMRKCGHTPTTTHGVKMPGRGKKIKCSCGCAGGCEMGVIQYRRMKRGTQYKCRKCKKTIS